MPKPKTNPNEMCREMVTESGGFWTVQCARRATTESGHCWQHDPKRVRLKRQEARHERDERAKLVDVRRRTNALRIDAYVAIAAMLDAEVAAVNPAFGELRAKIRDHEAVRRADVDSTFLGTTGLK